MNTNKLAYLQSMGIQSWQLKHREEPSFTTTDNGNSPQNCIVCGLCHSPTQTVFGVGNTTAELMVIGEAPGFSENQKGEPFVKLAGQLLDSMLEAIELDRTKVYIANILKCQPPSNRDPLPEEAKQCMPFLQQQIALVKPKLLMAVGQIAAHYLLDTTTALNTLRGKIHHFDETPLIVTYHPAYLLRNPKDKGKAFQDLQLAKSTLGM
jgi:uracil-DNA glycosylase family 4